MFDPKNVIHSMKEVNQLLLISMANKAILRSNDKFPTWKISQAMREKQAALNNITNIHIRKTAL